MDLLYEDPLSLSYVMVLDTEVMLAELEGFSEQPTSCANSIVHLNNLATPDVPEYTDHRMCFG